MLHQSWIEIMPMSLVHSSSRPIYHHHGIRTNVHSHNVQPKGNVTSQGLLLSGQAPGRLPGNPECPILRAGSMGFQQRRAGSGGVMPSVEESPLPPVVCTTVITCPTAECMYWPAPRPRRLATTNTSQVRNARVPARRLFAKG